MSLRNRLTILSITLMSLMTIPTLAENDTAPVTSRIENANFDVQIKTPEGWSQTKDFTSIPETFTHDGQVFQGIQFKSGLNNCVVFFTEDSEDDDEDVDLYTVLATAQELAFPGSTPLRVVLDGSFAADFKTLVAKANVKGTLEGTIANETGDPTKTTITGTIQSNMTKGNFVIASGTLSAEGAMPFNGTTGVQTSDEYQVIIAIWGTEEETQVKDTYRFLEALSVEKKAPVEIVAEPTTDNAVASEPVTETTSDIIIVTESVVVGDTVVVTESFIVIEPPVQEAPVITETPVVTTEASA